jgi:hypothetical protein
VAGQVANAWLTGQEFHLTDLGKSANSPPGALDSVPAKFSQEPPYFRAGRPPLEPFWPLICPISYPPVVEPMTFVNFDL